MKKSIAVICLLSLVLLSACNKGKGAEKITVADAGYTCDASIDYGENFSLKATINAVGGGIFSLTINEPKDISGLTYLFDNSQMSVKYDGTLKENNLPLGYGGFAEILNEIFLKFTTSAPTVYNKDGEYLYKGNNSEYSYEVIFNGQGFPIKLYSKEEKLKATFSNFRY